MRYIAINVNYKMDMDWYFRCSSVLECYQYFDRLEPGDGKRTAIYDTEQHEYLWIDEESIDNEKRLNAIIRDAMISLQKNR